MQHQGLPRRRREQGSARPRRRATVSRTTLAERVGRALAVWRRRSVGRWDGPRFMLALLVALLGASLAGGGSRADAYRHRGTETGAALPAVIQPTGRDLAINVQLERFTTSELEPVATALQTGGFRYVRQHFLWSDIEPNQGDFRWERADAMFEVLGRHDLIPIAVVHGTPSWARLPEAQTAVDAPPSDNEAFARFVAAFVDRFADRLRYLQIWDLPNLPERWGGQPPDPAAYGALLATGFNAARSERSDLWVIAAELAPPFAGAGVPAGDDLDFLRRLYAAGGSAFFDVAAVRLDGGRSSPEDRRIEPDRANLSRAILFRELMVEADDEGTPIWATHFGWNASEGLSRDDQARFAVSGLERARLEWPWMGLLFNWQFFPDLANNGVDQGYAALEASGSATPLYESLQSLTFGAQVAGTGHVPVDAEPFEFVGNWDVQSLEGGEFRTTSEVGAATTIRFAGTGLTAVLRVGPEAGSVEATLDGEPLDLDLTSSIASNLDVPLASGLEDDEHNLMIELIEPGQLTVGGVFVERRTPSDWPSVVLLIAGAALIAFGVREAVYTIARRYGHLQRRRGVDLWPELPVVPDWRPSRRV